jgi:hypothetical protein
MGYELNYQHGERFARAACACTWTRLRRHPKPPFILKREAPDGSLTKQTGRDERISTTKPRNRAERPSSERQASAEENQKSVYSSVCSFSFLSAPQEVMSVGRLVNYCSINTP